ncbi:hypothetical protein BHM03_00052262 [Ensete ventricosum]|nr:hypothetical protein BHM03_00052262 [Ensete ventricosum]
MSWYSTTRLIGPHIRGPRQKTPQRRPSPAQVRVFVRRRRRRRIPRFTYAQFLRRSLEMVRSAPPNASITAFADRNSALAVALK